MGIVLYLVVPCFNEEEVICNSANRLKEKFDELNEEGIISEKSRIVFVDDGSMDNTKDLLDELHKNDSTFSVIRFSRNFGHQNAVMAGYMFAANKCDAVISIDADLQQDVNAINEFIDMYRNGYEIVYGVRKSRDTDGFFKRATSQTYYNLMSLFGCGTIKNHADYRLLSKKVLKTLEQYRETNIFLRGLIPTLGYKSCIVYFDVTERMGGKSKYSLTKMMGLALDGITSHSIKPMHLVFITGWMILVCAIINMIYTLVVYILGNVVPGWSTIVISVWGIGGIQLIAIGCIGEYVGKNYIETKRRPRYIIDSIEHD